MASNKIKLTTNESGDWEILECDGQYEAQGHHMSNYDWIMLLRQLGYEVEEVEISDREMEELIWGKMSEKETDERRQELLDTPHEQLVEMFIRLKRLYVYVCDECNRLDNELDRIRETETYWDELIEDLDGED